jgi:hypothetical protein
MDNLSGFVEKNPRRLGSEYSFEVKSRHFYMVWFRRGGRFQPVIWLLFECDAMAEPRS